MPTFDGSEQSESLSSEVEPLDEPPREVGDSDIDDSQTSGSADQPGESHLTKVFVLDTSVILYDVEVLDRFQEHDVAIPITVLEELDGFKKGNNVLSHSAREFIRRLDRLSDDRDLRGWLPLNGPTRGKLCVITDEDDSRSVARVLGSNANDQRILGAALTLSIREPNRTVILISKDINLRVKARALGLCAEDYESVRVENVDHLYSGRNTVELPSDEAIEELYAEKSLPIDKVLDQVAGALGSSAGDNQDVDHCYTILRGPSKSALSVYDQNERVLRPVYKTPVYGITPRNAEQTFAVHAILDRDVPLVTLSGAAGTGKTLLALAGALEQRRDFRQIFLARPIVPLSNRDLGYLPGDVDSKISPYMQPLWDNLGVIRNQFSETQREYRQIVEMLEMDKLQIVPLAYIRGRSLNRVIFIVDEAQNLTPHEIKTIITRAGEGTKIIFTGDVFQIDTPYLDAKSNGLSYLIDRLRGHRLYAHVNLEKGERSELANVASQLL